jgi:hypothetical protein
MAPVLPVIFGGVLPVIFGFDVASFGPGKLRSLTRPIHFNIATGSVQAIHSASVISFSARAPGYPPARVTRPGPHFHIRRSLRPL